MSFPVLNACLPSTKPLSEEAQEETKLAKEIKKITDYYDKNFKPSVFFDSIPPAFTEMSNLIQNNSHLAVKSKVEKLVEMHAKLLSPTVRLELSKKGRDYLPNYLKAIYVMGEYISTFYDIDFALGTNDIIKFNRRTLSVDDLVSCFEATKNLVDVQKGLTTGVDPKTENLENKSKIFFNPHNKLSQGGYELESTARRVFSREIPGILTFAIGLEASGFSSYLPIDSNLQDKYGLQNAIGTVASDIVMILGFSFMIGSDASMGYKLDLQKMLLGDIYLALQIDPNLLKLSSATRLEIKELLPEKLDFRALGFKKQVRGWCLDLDGRPDTNFTSADAAKFFDDLLQKSALKYEEVTQKFKEIINEFAGVNIVNCGYMFIEYLETQVTKYNGVWGTALDHLFVKLSDEDKNKLLKELKGGSIFGLKRWNKDVNPMPRRLEDVGISQGAINYVRTIMKSTNWGDRLVGTRVFSKILLNIYSCELKLEDKIFLLQIIINELEAEDRGEFASGKQKRANRTNNSWVAGLYTVTGICEFIAGFFTGPAGMAIIRLLTNGVGATAFGALRLHPHLGQSRSHRNKKNAVKEGLDFIKEKTTKEEGPNNPVPAPNEPVRLDASTASTEPPTPISRNPTPSPMPPLPAGTAFPRVAFSRASLGTVEEREPLCQDNLADGEDYLSPVNSSSVSPMESGAFPQPDTTAVASPTPHQNQSNLNYDFVSYRYLEVQVPSRKTQDDGTVSLENLNKRTVPTNYAGFLEILEELKLNKKKKMNDEVKTKRESLIKDILIYAEYFKNKGISEFVFESIYRENENNFSFMEKHFKTNLKNCPLFEIIENILDANQLKNIEKLGSNKLEDIKKEAIQNVNKLINLIYENKNKYESIESEDDFNIFLSEGYSKAKTSKEKFLFSLQCSDVLDKIKATGKQDLYKNCELIFFKAVRNAAKEKSSLLYDLQKRNVKTYAKRRMMCRAMANILTMGLFGVLIALSICPFTSALGLVGLGFFGYFLVPTLCAVDFAVRKVGERFEYGTRIEVFGRVVKKAYRNYEVIRDLVEENHKSIDVTSPSSSSNSLDYLDGVPELLSDFSIQGHSAQQSSGQVDTVNTIDKPKQVGRTGANKLSSKEALKKVEKYSPTLCKTKTPTDINSTYEGNKIHIITELESCLESWEKSADGKRVEKINKAGDPTAAIRLLRGNINHILKQGFDKESVHKTLARAQRLILKCSDKMISIKEKKHLLCELAYRGCISGELANILQTRGMWGSARYLLPDAALGFLAGSVGMFIGIPQFHDAFYAADGGQSLAQFATQFGTQVGLDSLAFFAWVHAVDVAPSGRTNSFQIGLGSIKKVLSILPKDQCPETENLVKRIMSIQRHVIPSFRQTNSLKQYAAASAA